MRQIKKKKLACESKGKIHEAWIKSWVKSGQRPNPCSPFSLILISPGRATDLTARRRDMTDAA